MKKLALAPLVVAVALAGCGKPETLTNGKPSDPQAAEIAAAAPVKLPPALLASKTYRCKDNSLLYVDYFNDKMTANLKTEKTGAPIALAAPAAGEAYAGQGYIVKGEAPDKSVQITRPGKAAQACDA